MSIVFISATERFLASWCRALQRVRGEMGRFNVSPETRFNDKSTSVCTSLPFAPEGTRCASASSTISITQARSVMVSRSLKIDLLCSCCVSMLARCLLLNSCSIVDNSLWLHLDRGTRGNGFDRRTRICGLSQIPHPRWGLGVVVVVVRKSGSLAEKWIVGTRSPGPETWIIVLS
jgi:hypothetical protein